MQNVVKLAPPLKPCILLGVLLFWFMTGKSSWVHSHTQGLFSFVADDVMYHGYCKHCITPVVLESKTKGMVILYHLIYVLLLEMILNWLCIWTIVMLFQNYVASATSKFEL